MSAERQRGGSVIDQAGKWDLCLPEDRGQTFTEKELGRAQRRAAPRALERLLDALHHAYLYRLFGGPSHVLAAGVSGSLAVLPTTRRAGPAEESIHSSRPRRGRPQAITLIESIL
jgi:hypothetical protein